MLRRSFVGLTAVALVGCLGNGDGTEPTGGWTLSEEPYDAPNVEFTPRFVEGDFAPPENGVSEDYIEEVREETVEEFENQPNRQALFLEEDGESLALSQWRDGDGTVYQLIEIQADEVTSEYESYNDGTVYVRDTENGDEEFYRLESPDETEREFVRLSGFGFTPSYETYEAVEVEGTPFYRLHGDDEAAEMYVDTVGVARYLRSGEEFGEEFGAEVEAEILRGDVSIEQPDWIDEARDAEIRSTSGDV